MPILRLTQSTVSPDKFRVEAALEGDGLARQTATTEFDFTVTPQDREDIRWYLEDYLLHDADPAPKIAARIEGRIAAMGAELFKALFQANDDARDLWATLRENLNDTRVEIITEVQEATSLPWELLRDPKTDTPLALRAEAFVRAAHQVAQRPHISQSTTGPIRILLTICRPGGGSDVPFRSVASRLIKGLSESAREAFQLDVLRPATFAQLSKILRAAKAEGNPYHVVHFDGHGTYADVNEPGGLAAVKRALSSLVLSVARAGAHGYLLFENPGVEENLQLVDGPALGKLLVETDVPVLVLNACRSAHAESPAIPGTEMGQAGLHSATPLSGANPDVHGKVRAFGSLAQEVVDSGVAGVVAMRYNVYVVTAAQFVADLYESLARGQALGEAVTIGRKQLEAQPLREIAYQPRPLQDWMVPIIYEAAPVKLFPKPAQDPGLRITISADAAAPSSGALAPEVEKRPDAGFFGRDETILALDRAFDTQAIVLLHAYAGSGKTSTAAEFARWYHLTGGIDGPVLFTSFGQYKPLAQVLNETIGRRFSDILEQADVHWLTLTDEERRDVALQVMAQIPVLWIWDNIEPIAGFPAGTQSSWTNDEQEALADFLRAAKQTKAKFLLTSRRDERGWLGDLPARIRVPPMPMQERVQLARALAERHGRRLTDVEDWMPLLRFTGGNPLTITVLVGQALRDGLKTNAHIEAFVARLRAGEGAFRDEASEGRDKSLGASLSYGFAHAFSEVERRQLALLHVFQGFVDVDVLRAMGNSEVDWCLPEVRGLTREAGIALLDRAAEVGLLTAQGGGYYTIHPALPWFFKSLFEQHYSSLIASGEEPERKAAHSFFRAMGELGTFYAVQWGQGNPKVIAALAAEEANLLHARQLARVHGSWESVIEVMQGLRILYRHTGRRAEWAQLVDEIVPDSVDPATDGPLPGREEEWTFVTDYRVHLAGAALQWEQAERLQRVCVDFDRQSATSALAMPPESLDVFQRNAIRTLAVALNELGNILRQQRKAECVVAYEEDYDLSLRIGDNHGAAVTAFNLGHAYKDVPAIRDLRQAEHWYRNSLESHDERDELGMAQCASQLGAVAYERFREARTAKQPAAELLRLLKASEEFSRQALDLTPPDALPVLAVIHNSLGAIYGDGGDFDRALPHYRDAIRYLEAAGDLHGAAQTRRNVGIDLMNAGRLGDAREYAYAALRNLETYGDRAAEMIQRTQELIAAIEQAMQSE